MSTNFEVFSDSDDDEFEESSRSSSSDTSDMWQTNHEVLARYWETNIGDTSSDEDSVDIFLPEEEDSGINLDTRREYLARVKPTVTMKDEMSRYHLWTR